MASSAISCMVIRSSMNQLGSIKTKKTSSKRPLSMIACKVWQRDCRRTQSTRSRCPSNITTAWMSQGPQSMLSRPKTSASRPDSVVIALGQPSTEARATLRIDLMTGIGRDSPIWRVTTTWQAMRNNWSRVMQSLLRSMVSRIPVVTSHVHRLATLVAVHLRHLLSLRMPF